MTVHQQQHANSCGAVALMVGLHELDNQLPCDNNTETVIAHYVLAEMSPGGPMLCSPTKLRSWAKLNNRRAMFYVNIFVKPVLIPLYWKEYKRTWAGGVWIHGGWKPKLRGNKRQLTCVDGPAGLHWLLRRPDKSYMDPANGQDYPNWNALLGRYRKMHAYLVIS